jgi:hypothetical protein
MTDDIAILERAIERVGVPTILVGHSYDGVKITNAGYNNSNVTLIDSPEAICIEYIIAAIFMSRDARRNEVLPVIMKKNNLNYKICRT